MHVNDLLKIAVESGASDLHLKVGQLPDDARRRRAAAGVRGAAPDARGHGGDGRRGDVERASGRSSRKRRRWTSPTASRSWGGSAATSSSSAARSGWSCASSRCASRRSRSWGCPACWRASPTRTAASCSCTGTTGSGKSTTLAAMVDHINSTRCVHVMTIEDPIEFLQRDNRSIINQREVAVDTNSFSFALRSALRQDPDVILVGEMRDFETIETVAGGGRDRATWSSPPCTPSTPPRRSTASSPSSRRTSRSRSACSWRRC